MVMEGQGQMKVINPNTLALVESLFITRVLQRPEFGAMSGIVWQSDNGALFKPSAKSLL